MPLYKPFFLLAEEEGQHVAYWEGKIQKMGKFKKSFWEMTV